MTKSPPVRHKLYRVLLKLPCFSCAGTHLYMDTSQTPAIYIQSIADKIGLGPGIGTSIVYKNPLDCTGTHFPQLCA